MGKIAAWYGLKSGEDDDNNPVVFLIAPVSMGDTLPVFGTYKTTPGKSEQNIKAIVVQSEVKNRNGIVKPLFLRPSACLPPVGSAHGMGFGE